VAGPPPISYDEGDRGCCAASDGVLVCPRLDIRGQLREAPQILVGRASLGEGLGELRESFVDEIEKSVDGEPF